MVEQCNYKTCLRRPCMPDLVCKGAGRHPERPNREKRLANFLNLVVSFQEDKMQVLPVLLRGNMEYTRTHGAHSTPAFLYRMHAEQTLLRSNIGLSNYPIGHFLFLRLMSRPCLLQDPLAFRSPHPRKAPCILPTKAITHFRTGQQNRAGKHA